MISILLGIVSSTVAEIVTALNKKLAGTFLHGTASFLIAFGISIIGGIVKVLVSPGFTFASLTNISMIVNACTQVFTVSQIYFLLVVEKLGMDVQPANNVTLTVKSADAPTVAPAQSV